MFKKKCSKCENNVRKDYEFCPFCGNNFNKMTPKEDYGLIGKTDNIEDLKENNPFEENLMDKIFKSAMKMLESQLKNLPKELKENMKNPSPMPNKLNVQFFVNGKKIGPKQIEQNKNIKTMIKRPTMNKERYEMFSKLPKKEPSSKLRRLSGKIIYEFSMPGVKDLDDVIINRLENSIEIKAISNNQVYTKNLKINLPIIRYYLHNSNLYLELQTAPE